MYIANYAKFAQEPDLRRVLLSTFGPIGAQGGLYWKTWNEVVLERIREELRPEGCRDEASIALRVKLMEGLRAAAGEQRSVDAITTWAAKRLLPPAAPEDSALAVKVEQGAGADLFPWAGEGAFTIDALQPTVNGQAHYIGEQGGHLYLGKKGGRCAWCVDEYLAPSETSGEAFLEVTEHDMEGLPLGARVWQCFDGTRHQQRTLTLRTA
uniref:Uncharacterized protein n=1 Tax=Zooxanthella nutricula TaxID=1333877 RepID=A0A7S2PU71_9DINO